VRFKLEEKINKNSRINNILYLLGGTTKLLITVGANKPKFILNAEGADLTLLVQNYFALEEISINCDRDYFKTERGKQLLEQCSPVQ
jgi:hypothetical protein